MLLINLDIYLDETQELILKCMLITKEISLNSLYKQKDKYQTFHY